MARIPPIARKHLAGISKTFGPAPKDPTQRFIGILSHFTNRHNPVPEDNKPGTMRGKAKFSPNEQKILATAYKAMPPESQATFANVVQQTKGRG